MTIDATLYDRLGGESAIGLYTSSFFDELLEDPVLKPFFKHTSASVIKAHQAKLFRTVFGKESDKPSNDGLFGFILKAHTRLFRDLGLNEAHFDKLATCFCQSLQSFLVDQSLIDECMDILGSIRIVFVYGAQVAKQEQLYSDEQLLLLPIASTSSLGSPEPARLPIVYCMSIPDWLRSAMTTKQKRSSDTRAWTGLLMELFGSGSDPEIVETFLDRPYTGYHSYLVAFLHLAFFPDDGSKQEERTVRKFVRYPRGRKQPPISQRLFLLLINQLVKVCHNMGMEQKRIDHALNKLLRHRSKFADTTLQTNLGNCQQGQQRTPVDEENRVLVTIPPAFLSPGRQKPKLQIHSPSVTSNSSLSPVRSRITSIVTPRRTPGKKAEPRQRRWSLIGGLFPPEEL